MKKLLFIAVTLILTSCSENYSNGERIGVITQFSEKGMVCHEGHLNVTQTGMNSSVPFDFSVDNDNGVVSLLDSAAEHGWKVKLVYHETFGKNWWRNRGETRHFINKVEVLERNARYGYTYERREGTEVELSELKPNQQVCYGGKDWHVLMTEKLIKIQD